MEVGKGKERLQRASSVARSITSWLKDVLIAAAAGLCIVMAYHVLVATPKIELLISDSDQAVRSLNNSAKHLDEAVGYARDTLKTVSEASKKQSEYWESLSKQAQGNLTSLKRVTDNLAELEASTNEQLNKSVLPQAADAIKTQNVNATRTLAKLDTSLDELHASEVQLTATLHNAAMVSGNKDIQQSIYHVKHTLERVDLWTTRATKKHNIVVHGLMIALKALVTFSQFNGGIF